MCPTCSACKHQRRRCAPGCPLAPYFPGDEPAKFLAAHRLFGIKNITRFLTIAGPAQLDDCMKSMLFEAEARDADPVFGSLGVLRRLHAEHRLALEELEAERVKLAYWRANAEQRGAPPPP